MPRVHLDHLCSGVGAHVSDVYFCSAALGHTHISACAGDAIKTPASPLLVELNSVSRLWWKPASHSPFTCFSPYTSVRESSKNMLCNGLSYLALHAALQTSVAIFIWEKSCVTIWLNSCLSLITLIKTDDEIKSFCSLAGKFFPPIVKLHLKFPFTACCL